MILNSNIVNSSSKNSFQLATRMQKKWMRLTQIQRMGVISHWMCNRGISGFIIKNWIPVS